MPLAVAILSSIAKEIGCHVKYFETSFYEKPLSASEEREGTGEFKPVHRAHSVDLLPRHQMRTDFYEILADYKPDILAVTANSLEYDLFSELVGGADISKANPFIILGGVHATIASEDAIQNPHINALCVGEGEQVWEEFLIKFKNGEDITTINNLWVKTPSGVTKNPLRRLVSSEDLWKTPLDFSFFDERHFMKPFDGKFYRRGQIELSRGCPYRCNYCVNSTFQALYGGLGKFFRVRSLDSVRAAVKDLISLGCEMLQLQDECFFSIKDNTLKEFCDWYGKEVGLPLLLQTRPESVTDEKVKVVADMGVLVQISCGVESGNERILRDICNRQTTVEQTANAFAIIRKYKLRSNAYTMIGFPTETRQEVFETIELIRQLNPDVSVMSTFFPFWGVPLRKLCLEKGYISGTEKARTFSAESILKNQAMSGIEIMNLRRTFRLYTKLPREYYPKIELCEKEPQSHESLFAELVSLSWKY